MASKQSLANTEPQNAKAGEKPPLAQLVRAGGTSNPKSLVDNKDDRPSTIFYPAKTSKQAAIRAAVQKQIQKNKLGMSERTMKLDTTVNIMERLSLIKRRLKQISKINENSHKLMVREEAHDEESEFNNILIASQLTSESEEESKDNKGGPATN